MWPYLLLLHLGRIIFKVLLLLPNQLALVVSLDLALSLFDLLLLLLCDLGGGRSLIALEEKNNVDLKRKWMSTKGPESTDGKWYINISVVWSTYTVHDLILRDVGHCLIEYRNNNNKEKSAKCERNCDSVV